VKLNYEFLDNEKITAQFVLGDVVWIAFASVDGISKVYGCSIYDLDIIYWELDVVGEISSIISIDTYLYLALDDDTNICAEFNSSNPSDIWYLAKDEEVTEEAIDLVWDSLSYQVYFLSPGLATGENAKITVYDYSDNYVETIDLPTVSNASKISADEDGNLWVLSDLDSTPIITKIWQETGGWDYFSYLLV